MNFIKVNFKKSYDNDFDDRSYTYENELEAEEGDIVVVETSKGLAIAKVAEVNVENDYNGELKKTVVIAKTATEIKEEEKARKLKEKRIRKAIRAVKEKKIADNLLLTMDTEFLKDLSDDELDKIYNELYKEKEKTAIANVSSNAITIDSSAIWCVHE